MATVADILSAKTGRGKREIAGALMGMCARRGRRRRGRRGGRKHKRRAREAEQRREGREADREKGAGRDARADRARAVPKPQAPKGAPLVTHAIASGIVEAEGDKLD